MYSTVAGVDADVGGEQTRGHKQWFATQRGLINIVIPVTDEANKKSPSIFLTPFQAKKKPELLALAAGLSRVAFLVSQGFASTILGGCLKKPYLLMFVLF